MGVQPLLLFAVLAAWLPDARAAESEPTQFFFEMVKVPASEYWAAKYEVTQKQYEEITGENPSRFEGSDHPVDSVSWDDAVAFCEKLTAREQAAGRLPKDYRYDLPTDAQWDQFAAGTDLQDAVLSTTQVRTGTQPVGTTRPNPCGLYDVAGNVWEWCRDWYNNDIRKKDSNKDLPSVPTDAEAAAQGPEETFKVLRGGAVGHRTSGPFYAFQPAALRPGDEQLPHWLSLRPGASQQRQIVNSPQDFDDARARSR